MGPVLGCHLSLAAEDDLHSRPIHPLRDVPPAGGRPAVAPLGLLVPGDGVVGVVPRQLGPRGYLFDREERRDWLAPHIPHLRPAVGLTGVVDKADPSALPGRINDDVLPHGHAVEVQPPLLLVLCLAGCKLVFREDLPKVRPNICALGKMVPGPDAAPAILSAKDGEALVISCGLTLPLLYGPVGALGPLAGLVGAFVQHLPQ
mmetsp:Transcript_40272/g.71952  ORF Transcript_40272/g.71952 Transcript_40272/m.71952 type:complete len:203 (+) Transcript_40272:235-843(+)